ncbi:MAG: SGNH/GDSL hydrolase family protein [Jatrophihabitans sp.]|uniref:SGNH/GDSL hydrolase family protein n=1 Tax=Jatrophihabitans sp. TaxID=1932789 RepID=UPI003F7F1E43
MLSSVFTRPRRLGATVLAAACVAGLGVAPASAAPPGGHVKKVHRSSDYLALGDSVAFGYREANNPPTPDYTNAANFTGYPELVGRALHLRVANASCPGETSGSLNSATTLSYACGLTPTGLNGYKEHYPLHVSYAGTQLQYALDYLRHHRDTRLVTLMIGANDGFLCQATTADQCASEIGGVLAKVAANVTTTLEAIRQQAHYRGQIVIVDYYSLDYRSAAANASSQGLNQAMNTAAKPFGVTVADAYTLFQQAAAQNGGDTCAAGLLTVLTGGGCGVHPSVAGQALLAQAVEGAIRR